MSSHSALGTKSAEWAWASQFLSVLEMKQWQTTSESENFRDLPMQFSRIRHNWMVLGKKKSMNAETFYNFDINIFQRGWWRFSSSHLESPHCINFRFEVEFKRTPKEINMVFSYQRMLNTIWIDEVFKNIFKRRRISFLDFHWESFSFQ